MFETGYLLEFAEAIINYIKDAQLANEEGEFSTNDLDLSSVGLDEVKAKAVLKVYFNQVGDSEEPSSPLSNKSAKLGAMELENLKSGGEDKFKWSWKKITMFCVEYFFTKKQIWQYDEYLQMIHDAVRIFLPARVYTIKSLEEREELVSRQTEKLGIIEDRMNYGQKHNQYLPEDIRLVKLEYQDLPDDPKER